MNNDWYEKGEMPPVGEKCEFKLGNFWKPCEIKGEAFDYGHRLVLVQIGEGCKTTGEVKLFRPIKSDREKAIEAAGSICKLDLADVFGELYDAGLLSLPEDK